MALDGSIDETDADADFEILEAIGAHVEAMIQGLIDRGVVQKTIRRWLVGHAGPPDDDDAMTCLAAMAADLELFTPATSGRTMVDRYVAARTPAPPEDRAALRALGAAQLRLVRITGREGPDLVRLEDLVTGESLLLLQSSLSSGAAGLSTAMRLCPLESGRHVLTSPLFAMDEAMVGEAMRFVRPGRPLGHGHRCAASLYRDMARRGVMPLPQQVRILDAHGVIGGLGDGVDQLTPIERLAARWASLAQTPDERVDEARRLTSPASLVEACDRFARTRAAGPGSLRAAFEAVAAVLVETMIQRRRAGVGGSADLLGEAAAQIAARVARRETPAAAGDLLDRLRRRWAFGRADEDAGDAAAAAASNIDGVLARIQALRARTVERGCTEAEAIAAAAKVSELLGRHNLTLDEVSVRRSACEGVSVATGRKRRAPVDSCVTDVAAFCDCRVWSEEDDEGALRYVFFGLRADVEAARFLHDLIEAAFETEGAAFRRGDIYQGLRGGDRRMAHTSFQVGLARGITGKLAALKAARGDGGAARTGFDLVAVKGAVIDDEIARLGLGFVTRQASSRRLVHGEAYAAGQAAGARFEPNLALDG